MPFVGLLFQGSFKESAAQGVETRTAASWNTTLSLYIIGVPEDLTPRAATIAGNHLLNRGLDAQARSLIRYC